MKVINNIFTEREKEIVLLLIEGKNKGEIAKILNLSISTIKTYIEKLYSKFNVHNRVEFIIYIIKNNIINLK